MASSPLSGNYKLWYVFFFSIVDGPFTVYDTGHQFVGRMGLSISPTTPNNHFVNRLPYSLIIYCDVEIPFRDITYKISTVLNGSYREVLSIINSVCKKTQEGSMKKRCWHISRLDPFLPYTLEKLNNDEVKNQGSVNLFNTILDTSRIIGQRPSNPSVRSNMELLLLEVDPGPGNQPILMVADKNEMKQFIVEEDARKIRNRIVEPQQGSGEDRFLASGGKVNSTHQTHFPDARNIKSHHQVDSVNKAIAKDTIDTHLHAIFKQLGESGTSFSYFQSIKNTNQSISEQQITVILSKVQCSGNIQPLGCMAFVDKSNFQVITYNKNAMTLLDHNPKLVPNLNKHETITVDTDINTLFTPFSMGLFGKSKKLMVCTTSRAQLASQLSRKHPLLIQTLFCDVLTAIVTRQNSRIVDFMRYDSAAFFYQGKYYPVHVSTGLNVSSLTEVGYPGAAFLGDAVCVMVAAYTASLEFWFWLQSHVAKEIKWGALELLRHSNILSFTIQPISTKYWLKGETTGFNKLHENGVNKPKANSSFIPVKDLAFLAIQGSYME
uniref:PAS fold-2 domain-containing protein n=1 Tax=Nelumbo nucifera TaxID=4432 RepID=A0A822YIB9_NELNU|nr:TPA_asm: hypothetical protein HUJ06_011181 [Nelumbo nucifera]